jgi:hypothetical protein
VPFRGTSAHLPRLSQPPLPFPEKEIFLHKKISSRARDSINIARAAHVRTRLPVGPPGRAGRHASKKRKRKTELRIVNLGAPTDNDLRAGPAGVHRVFSRSRESRPGARAPGSAWAAAAEPSTPGTHLEVPAGPSRAAQSVRVRPASHAPGVPAVPTSRRQKSAVLSAPRILSSQVRYEHKHQTCHVKPKHIARGSGFPVPVPDRDLSLDGVTRFGDFFPLYRTPTIP